MREIAGEIDIGKRRERATRMKISAVTEIEKRSCRERATRERVRLVIETGHGNHHAPGKIGLEKEARVGHGRITADIIEVANVIAVLVEELWREKGSQS